eukprot:12413053-Karenia_brevis.AAC.1
MAACDAAVRTDAQRDQLHSGHFSLRDGWTLAACGATVGCNAQGELAACHDRLRRSHLRRTRGVGGSVWLQCCMRAAGRV